MKKPRAKSSGWLTWFIVIFVICCVAYTGFDMESTERITDESTGYLDTSTVGYMPGKYIYNGRERFIGKAEVFWNEYNAGEIGVNYIVRCPYIIEYDKRTGDILGETISIDYDTVYFDTIYYYLARPEIHATVDQLLHQELAKSAARKFIKDSVNIKIQPIHEGNN
jgi:hypothetical protein